MTVSLPALQRLFAYTRWANARTLESVEPLTAEEYGRQVGGSFGSIRGTLVHLYGADWVWLERLHGRSPRALPSADESVASLESLREKWRAVEDATAAFADGLTPDRLETTVTYVNFVGETWTYTLGDALLHIANHGTYHRGQIATLLRILGRTPVSTDYLRWIDEGAPAAG
jgi:uncharacterized damage-inducible protein DinB